MPNPYETECCKVNDCSYVDDIQDMPHAELVAEYIELRDALVEAESEIEKLQTKIDNIIGGMDALIEEAAS